MAKVKNISNKELYYEIIVSKAQGFLTKRAMDMLIELGARAIKKNQYFCEEDEFDCLQTAYYVIFNNWYNFDEDKGNNAFAYYTEIFKRGTTRGLNEIHNKKGILTKVKVFSIESSNNGMGLHSI